ncbi:GNAT family N-acetyltransferase [Anaerovibrio sp. RM50]|uniref:GNAT family N-acetyltransferase n=1 Tax=Anaerovibrio sp. RM50 TaxID=1200557 RepID=UPI0006852680|nr:GNAT family N-acetyltransferase [Anaerovibrio sp. RM50]
MQYRIIDGAENLNINDVVRLLKMTYWADKRPIETIEKSMQNSACYGIYIDAEKTLVAFARVISDYATTYYLCDVIVDTAYQHMGIGTALISYIEALTEYTGLRGVLITRDAQGLYKKFGYEVLNDRAMVKQLQVRNQNDKIKLRRENS